MDKLDQIRRNLVEHTEKNKLKDGFICPFLEGPLVSYSLFHEIQTCSFTQEELKSAYEEYKQKYETNRFKKYFQIHKDDSWFCEKYDLSMASKVAEEKRRTFKRLREMFKSKFEAGLFKGIRLQLTEEVLSDSSITVTFEDTKEVSRESSGKSVEIDEAPFFAFNPDKNTLFCSQIPTSISRIDMVNLAEECEGFLSIQMSEPMKANGYSRFCWILFESAETASAALEKVNSSVIQDKNYQVNFTVSKSNNRRVVKVKPMQFDDRTEIDAINLRKIVSKLDNVFGSDVFV